MTTCPKCGYQNKDSWKFCKKCGTPIGVGDGKGSSQSKAVPRRSPRMLFLVIGLIVLSLFSLSALVYVIFSRGNTSSNSNKTSIEAQPSTKQGASDKQTSATDGIKTFQGIAAKVDLAEFDIAKAVDKINSTPGNGSAEIVSMLTQVKSKLVAQQDDLSGAKISDEYSEIRSALDSALTADIARVTDLMNGAQAGMRGENVGPYFDKGRADLDTYTTNYQEFKRLLAGATK